MEGRPKLGMIIVCRMDSARCPGKVLADVQGSPLLEYVVKRAQQVASADVFIATSDRSIDNPIADFAEKHGLTTFRGSAQDVANRVLNCALENKLDWFARINGDSPYLSPELIKQGFQRATDEQLDFVTNLSPRSYPYGIACEVLRTDFFNQQVPTFDQPRYREHVTLRIYEQLPSIRYRNLSLADANLSQHRMVVDTPEDLSLFRSHVALAGKRWQEVSFQDVISWTTPVRRAA